jgi:CheY-like chemotaxis protein
MREILKLLFTRNNFTVYEADDEIKAVAVTANQKPQIILMSLSFDRHNKFSLVKKLKAMNRCIVIAYSDTIYRNDVVAGFIATIDDILLKPWQQQERLFKYFLLSPVEIRQGILYPQGKFAPPTNVNQETSRQHSGNPGYIEGGTIRWRLKEAN